MNTIKLTGSEKQIAWAEKIRKSHAYTLNSLIELFEKIAAVRPNIAKPRNAVTALVSIRDNDSAKFWIEGRELLENLDLTDCLAEEKAKVLATLKLLKEAGHTI